MTVYEATIWGKGIRNRCRKSDTILVNLPLQPGLEISYSLVAEAKEVLAKRYKQVFAAKIRIEEVEQEKDGAFIVTHDKHDSRRIERVLI